MLSSQVQVSRNDAKRQVRYFLFFSARLMQLLDSAANSRGAVSIPRDSHLVISLGLICPICYYCTNKLHFTQRGLDCRHNKSHLLQKHFMLWEISCSKEKLQWNGSFAPLARGEKLLFIVSHGNALTPMVMAETWPFSKRTIILLSLPTTVTATLLFRSVFGEFSCQQISRWAGRIPGTLTWFLSNIPYWSGCIARLWNELPEECLCKSQYWGSCELF